MINTKPEYLYNPEKCPCPRGGSVNCPRYRKCEVCVAFHREEGNPPQTACEKKGGVMVRKCTMEHLKEYGRIYAAAFAGEPWNDPWKPEDAETHIKELLECRTSYGLEFLKDGQVAGFILGTSMLFHYGRTFEINDLAVAPDFQGIGIAKQLMGELLRDLKKQGIVGVHLITASAGFLPEFYDRFGFKKENDVILMGLDF